jgi:hypothetical protein
MDGMDRVSVCRASHRCRSARSRSAGRTVAGVFLLLIATACAVPQDGDGSGSAASTASTEMGSPTMETSPPTEPPSASPTVVPPDSDSPKTSSPNTAPPPEETGRGSSESPQPSTPPKATPTASSTSSDVDVFSFLGQVTYEDDDFVEYVSRNDCYMGMGFSYVCDQSHTEFSLDSNSRIIAVFAFPEYEGTLPGGISFDDSRDQLVLTLGQPEVIHDTLWRWQNGNAHLLVTFDAAPPERIAQIQLDLPS